MATEGTALVTGASAGLGVEFARQLAVTTCSLSEELALVLRGTDVKVCALCPGFVHTDFHEVAGLMEMKRQLPGFVWYDAETVVSEGLDAVDRGRSVRVTGRIYRWLDPLAQSVWTRPLLKALAPGR